jgi:pyrroloquinoline quinone biosynthesis protein B
LIERGRSIRIRILGSAAGGGLPQWNCSCANCVAARAGKIPPQTQSSVAITADDRHWFLINASPDLPRQIENTPELQPSPASPRNSPISGIFLTNADLDHALGLVSLRQQENPLIIYADSETRAALRWIDNLLNRFCRTEWGDLRSLGNGLAVSAIVLKNGAAFQFHDERSRKNALIAPAVGELNEALRAAINSAEVVLFDGTFWNNDELRAVRPNARTAREMNHLPIRDGTLEFLRDCPARRKIYMHINNTNPILMPGSPERAAIERAGIEIARDGLEILL